MVSVIHNRQKNCLIDLFIPSLTADFLLFSAGWLATESDQQNQLAKEQSKRQFPQLDRLKKKKEA